MAHLLRHDTVDPVLALFLSICSAISKISSALKGMLMNISSVSTIPMPRVLRSEFRHHGEISENRKSEL